MKKRSVENELLAAVRRLQRSVDHLTAENARLKSVIAEKDKRICDLETELAKAKKNSSTSSRPPSSDIVKPSRKPKRKKGKIGGQPGHPKHERKPFTPGELDSVQIHSLDECPVCGDALRPIDDDPQVVQQVEIRDKPLRVDEHRGLWYWCDRCQRKHRAPLPPEVERGGLIGPRLTALVAYLKGFCHASFSTIRKYLRDVLGIKVSRGLLSRVVQRVSEALERAYSELRGRLPQELRINVDETGHKENGDRYWTWCFRAEAFVFFTISESRGSDVLFEMLGREFEGTVGCDYFSAYRKFMKDADVLVQFCLAHLIRDIKYLTTLRSPSTVAYGECLLRCMRQLFKVFHSCESDSPGVFQKKLERLRKRITFMALTNVPKTNEAQNLANRFRKHGDAYFQFITTPGISPTNNIAEQAIRFVVIDRLVTQGTRGERGRTWCERIWTVAATCAQQGRSAYNFILESVQAHFAGRPGPSLLPVPVPASDTS